jgi:hypothetical protein
MVKTSEIIVETSEIAVETSEIAPCKSGITVEASEISPGLRSAATEIPSNRVKSLLVPEAGAV